MGRRGLPEPAEELGVRLVHEVCRVQGSAWRNGRNGGANQSLELFLASDARLDVGLDGLMLRTAELLREQLLQRAG
jgi:hypothetical protein